MVWRSRPGTLFRALESDTLFAHQAIDELDMEDNAANLRPMNLCMSATLTYRRNSYYLCRFSVYKSDIAARIHWSQYA